MSNWIRSARIDLYESLIEMLVKTTSMEQSASSETDTVVEYSNEALAKSSGEEQTALPETESVVLLPSDIDVDRNVPATEDLVRNLQRWIDQLEARKSAPALWRHLLPMLCNVIQNQRMDPAIPANEHFDRLRHETKQLHLCEFLPVR